VRAILPIGEGVVLDPFAGSGSTLAAAEAVGYESIGVELDLKYVELAKSAIPALAAYKNGNNEKVKPKREPRQATSQWSRATESEDQRDDDLPE